MRFGAFKRELPDITAKMLSQQLRELERDGLVERRVYPQVPPKVEYSLSEFGRTLKPILETIAQWGLENREQIVRLLEQPASEKNRKVVA
jgi:DNA-binding HxlR family transcriptional regulator